MEIYKLDDCPERTGDLSKLRITGLKQGVKNPNRVNVFVDGKFAFSLDVAQVVDFKIKAGKLLEPEELLEYQKASEFGKLYQRALEWVLTRSRSEKELRDYLYKKVYEKKLDKKYIDDIVEKLKEKKYLDDTRFAEWYVENRFVKKGVSARRLRIELMKKGVEKSIIEEVLSASERNDKDEILKIIAKKRAKYTDEKFIQYLCRQGFSFELVSELVRSSGTD